MILMYDYSLILPSIFVEQTFFKKIYLPDTQETKPCIYLHRAIKQKHFID